MPADRVAAGRHEHGAAGRKRADDVIPAALNFFDSRARNSRPWLASLGLFEVHHPYDRYPRDDPDRVELPPYVPDCPEAREDAAAFHGAIRYMDAKVGEVLDALDRNGLSESTVVIFTTDHGPAWPRAKTTTYDPGLRCALIIRHPTTADPGAVVDTMTSHVDLTPSMPDLMGLPSPVRMEGLSFAPALRGQSLPSRKCIYAENVATRAIRTTKFKYVRNYKDDLPLVVAAWLRDRAYAVELAEELSPLPTEELYDLQADPMERRNLIDVPKLRPVRDNLRGELAKWQEATDDEILNGTIPEWTLK